MWCAFCRKKKGVRRRRPEEVTEAWMVLQNAHLVFRCCEGSGRCQYGGVIDERGTDFNVPFVSAKRSMICLCKQRYTLLMNPTYLDFRRNLWNICIRYTCHRSRNWMDSWKRESLPNQRKELQVQLEKSSSTYMNSWQCTSNAGYCLLISGWSCKELGMFGLWR